MNNETISTKKGGTKPLVHLLPMMALLVFGMIALVGVVSADDYFKGGLLTTNNDISKVDNITGSGDFWYQANNCWNSTSGLTTYTNTSTFTIPAAAKGNASWARLWVAVYMGNMTDNSYQGNENITLNNGGGDIYLADEQQLDPNEDYMNLDYYRGIGITHANQYISTEYITDINRVTSDYINEFNVTGLINDASSQTIIVNTTTNKISGNFDGRIKAAVLAIGYNDSDITNDKYYWVNVGHDTMTKNATDPSVYNYTTFNDLPNYNSTAQLDAIFLASADGKYQYSTDGGITKTSLSSSQPGFSGLGYFGYNSWTIPYTANENINFFYNRNYPSQSYYKTILAFLTVDDPSK